MRKTSQDGILELVVSVGRGSATQNTVESTVLSMSRVRELEIQQPK